MHCLTTRVSSEEFIIRQFCPCANVTGCTQTKLHGAVADGAPGPRTSLRGTFLYTLLQAAGTQRHFSCDHGKGTVKTHYYNPVTAVVYVVRL